MLFANVCAGFSAAVTRVVGYGAFGAFWVLLGALCTWRRTSFASVPPHVYRTRVTKVCLSVDTPLGQRSVGALYA